ncbi:hypothetical protein ACE6H2_003281 [Prunus campanulata]
MILQNVNVRKSIWLIFLRIVANLNPQHSEVWGKRPNSTTIDILLVRTKGRQRDIHMPLDTAEAKKHNEKGEKTKENDTS